MEMDLDTFLVTVYCIVDDLYQEHYAHLKPNRPGRSPELSDSEVLTLALLAQWHSSRSERAFLRHAARHWRGYFPRLLSQSAFNRRMRDLLGVLSHMGPAIAREVSRVLGGEPAYEAMDAVPVPLMRRCRGNRHRLFGWEASIGRGGSDRGWYYGVKLLAAVNQDGVATGFVAGRANTEDRWLAEALLRWRRYPDAPSPTAEELAPILGPSHRNRGKRLGPDGPLWPQGGIGEPPDHPYVADLGYSGATWKRHWWNDYGAAVLTQADYAPLAPDEARRSTRWLNGKRQTVETAFSLLYEVFGLAFPKARTPWGLRTRVAAKIAALDIAVLINHLFKRRKFEVFNPFG